MSFDLDVVFSSAYNFLSSGYIGFIVFALLGFSLVKKIMKLIVIAAVACVIFILLNTGVVEEFFLSASALSQSLHF